MNTLGPCEIGIGNQILGELLLKSGVRRVNTRIGIVLTKDGDTRTNRKGSRRNCGRYNDAWVCRQIASGSVKKTTRESSCSDRLLLDAIRGDGTDLRQHVLPRVIDSPTPS